MDDKPFQAHTLSLSPQTWTSAPHLHNQFPTTSHWILNPCTSRESLGADPDLLLLEACSSASAEIGFTAKNLSRSSGRTNLDVTQHASHKLRGRRAIGTNLPQHSPAR